jgi:hypothetical protein
MDNLRFLYVATLFRQSRHYSAFLSEGMMRCPQKFNEEGRDNDWLRNDALKATMSDLFLTGFFYEKAGGFAWAYQDFRLGVRRMIASIPTSVIRAANFQPLEAWRSSYHYWISEWYMRAFYTCGHATPLMESIFHLFQCILHLPQFAKFGKQDPKAMAWRRYGMWRAAICDIIKALRLGKDSIRLWFGAPDFETWFAEETLRKIDIEAKVTDNLTIILRPLRGDATSYAEAKEHSRNLIEALNAELVQASVKEKHVKVVVPAAYIRGDGTRKMIRLPDAITFGESDNLSKGMEPGPVRDICELVYNLPKRPIPVIDDDDQKWERESAKLKSEIAEWRRAQIKRNVSDQALYGLVQEMNECAYSFFVRAKARQQCEIHRQREKVSPTRRCLGLDDDIKRLWLTVTVLCNSSVELCRLIHPAMASMEQRERCKGLSLYAVALARLGRFYEAHRRLNEANALLRNIDTRSIDVILGIQKLRRAEVHILEGMLMGELATERKPDGLDQNHIWKRYGIKGPDPLLDAKQMLEYEERETERLTRLRTAKLDDAWCALETAHQLLVGKLHSSRWWAQLCILKLRCLMEQPKGGSYRSLARREQREEFDRIIQLFMEGIATSIGNPQLSLYIIDIALRAAHNVSASKQTKIAKMAQVLSLIKSCSEELDAAKQFPILEKYLEQVNAFRDAQY